jgi:hypothetical protein
MNKRIDELLWSLSLDKISEQEFLKEYSKIIKTDVNDEYCINLLKKGLTNKDGDKIDEALTVASILGCFSEKFSEIFCELLKVDCHYEHENIAMLLKDFKDPSTVNCLFDATHLQFDYLDYDDNYQFARKCIKALADIDNEEAINKLHLLTQHDNPIIGDYAAKELRYKAM